MADEPLRVHVTDDPGRHRYEAFIDDALAGFAAYELTPGGITFSHTKTLPAFEGHGVGSQLAATALDDARARGLRVTVACPFIGTYIEHHPAYADLLDPSS
jgi:predicted GNAT family acetyltransferase